MSEILHIIGNNISSLVQPKPKTQVRELSAQKPDTQRSDAQRPDADDETHNTTESSSTVKSKRGHSSSRSNRANHSDDDSKLADATSAMQSTSTTLEADDSTTPRSDDTTTAKDDEQFTTVLDKAMKGRINKNNIEAEALAGSVTVAATAPVMINLQPTGITGDNSDGVESVSTNTVKNDILSLLGATQQQNTKPEIISMLQPLNAKAEKDDITSVVDTKQMPETKPEISSLLPQPGSIDDCDVKHDAVSLKEPIQQQNVTPPKTGNLITGNLMTGNTDALKQALVKPTTTDAASNMSAVEIKIPEIKTPEQLTAALKPPDNVSQAINLVDLNSVRHAAKNELSSKESSDILSELSPKSNAPQNNLPVINIADSSGSQLSKHDLSKDTPDTIKEVNNGDSKQDDGISAAVFSVDKTQVHEALGKTSQAATGDTGEKLAVGGAKTVELNGNRFTITRKTDTSIEVKLEPDGIGKLDISVNVQKGVLNANISASDSAAKGIIEKNLHEIVSALTKEGLTVGGFTVSLKDRGGNYKEGKNEQSAAKHIREERQLQPIAVTGYARTAYKYDGISIFA
ncbi:flagellar hook-length control protein FliK [Candidatus Magnetominusculus xianensis]|uniref:Flagellar hook-length control protein FliK n=1 Tax=Candidatus Magnetominusculus xianensis TaxID=1748249 RepID=A0ABR5SIT7_9BACT|nr:flagellar hook-length control protein FliK [Candidatus Magnetominusculus xianensis]KWT85133.1 flagellar hook-length control protein FliK [Candidatus Magnetominusculus xianensis]MBF0405391.1 flagellar hook-length control protein FliK [Nitrospirota bacterium]